MLIKKREQRHVAPMRHRIALGDHASAEEQVDRAPPTMVGKARGVATPMPHAQHSFRLYLIEDITVLSAHFRENALQGYDCELETGHPKRTNVLRHDSPSEVASGSAAFTREAPWAAEDLEHGLLSRRRKVAIHILLWRNGDSIMIARHIGASF
jgi:hypothetical protein